MRSLEHHYKRISDARDVYLELPLSEPACRAKVRSFYISALEQEHNVGYLFRFLPREFTLEDDLIRVMDAFSETDTDYSENRVLANLKHLRRIAFQRYAFRLALQLNKRLRSCGVSRIWLSKDFFLPRIPLSLAIGYPIVLTLPKEWLWVVGQHLGYAAVVFLFSCLLAWFLIYNNVRDRVGDIPGTMVRTTCVFFGSLAWSAIFLGAGKKLAELDTGYRGLRESFDWPTAILTAVLALVVAIVAQFFFTKSGSIADPL